MSIWESILLGIVQGLTEFLPISSSGHLEIVKFITQNNLTAKESLLFTIVLHAATSLSILFVFKKEVTQIFKGLFKGPNNSEFWFAVKIGISMIPALIVGLFFEDFISSLFEGNLLLVGICLLVTAVLLFFADKERAQKTSLTFIKSLYIGISQAIAILPGVSRSGATISTALLLGIKKEEATRFSFLMVVPLIVGSIAKELLDAEAILTQSTNISALLIGFVAAFLVGIIACRWMIVLVRKSNLYYFSIYCIVVGGFSILYYFLF